MTGARVTALRLALLGVAVLLVPAAAVAQTVWGISRQDTRGEAAREDYLYALPAGHRVATVKGRRYYEVGRVRYQAQMVEGRVVYVPAGDRRHR